jgi:hypothetical protein
VPRWGAAVLTAPTINGDVKWTKLRFEIEERIFKGADWAAGFQYRIAVRGRRTWTNLAMNSESTRRALMMPLSDLVARYEALAGRFGTAVALSGFGLTREETERIFSAYDEDYHISRFLHFSDASGTAYVIDGERVTHVAIDAEIKSIL